MSSNKEELNTEPVLLQQLKRITGIVHKYESEDGSNPHAAVRDIMIELQHFCRESNIDFYDRYLCALEGYLEEMDEACFSSEEEGEDDGLHN